MNNEIKVMDLLGKLDTDVKFVIVDHENEVMVDNDDQINIRNAVLLTKPVKTISWEFGTDRLWIEV